MPWARASELDRILACDGSTYLPRSDVKSERTQEAADWGTMAHHWAATGEICPQPGRKTHAARFKDKLQACGSPDRLVFWPELPTAERELSVAYHIPTGEVTYAAIPEKAAQDAWKATFPDTYVVGTLDYAALLLGRAWVDDLKTGRWPPSVSSLQLVFYAMCTARLLHVEEASASITHWPRYPLAQAPVRTGRVLTWNDLQDFEDLLESRWSQRPGPLTTGEQCTFCPSRAFCSAYLAQEAIRKENGSEDYRPQEGQLLHPDQLHHRRPPNQGPGDGDVRGGGQDRDAAKADVPGRDQE